MGYIRQIDGIPVALKGDASPAQSGGHNDCKIAEGDPNHTINGVPVAYEGHKTTCGALLISTIESFRKD